VIRSSHGAGWRAVLPCRLLIAAVAALIPALAGCEAGANAPTQQWHPPTEGTGVVEHGIDIRDMFVLGASPNSSLAAGQSAGLFFALYNNGAPDRLLSISAPGTAKSVQLLGGTFRPGSQRILVTGGTVSLGRGQEVLLTGPRPRAVLTGLTRALPGGSYIRVLMKFQNAGIIPLSVPVLPRAQYYTTFSPAPSPSPTPKASPTSTPGATPAPTPTPSPSAS
jgi:hypothetical protein